MKLELLHTHDLPDFPSASSINLNNGEFYLIGDDANDALVLDHDYNVIDRLPLFDYPGKRIPKAEKADLESSVLLNIHDELHLVAFGSASKDNRKKILSLSASKSKDLTLIDNKLFVDRLREKGIEEINLEGATVVGDTLLFVNRGSYAYTKNHLVITSRDFWNRQKESPVSVSEISIPANGNMFTGVSEIHYVSSKDMLLFTLTSEATSNSYDDGVIGDSYVGWICSASNGPMHILHGLINLSEVDPGFKGQKIEGICAEASGENELTLHVVADNDSGESKIFRLRMTIE